MFRFPSTAETKTKNSERFQIVSVSENSSEVSDSIQNIPVRTLNYGNNVLQCSCTELDVVYFQGDKINFDE